MKPWEGRGEGLLIPQHNRISCAFRGKRSFFMLNAEWLTAGRIIRDGITIMSRKLTDFYPKK